jgi:uncharacterized membrane protein YfcA
VINIGLLVLGLIAGVLAGMFGIGGGIVIVPALIYFFNLSDKAALGTSLAALIPPVGLLGAIEYYRAGYMNMRFAALIAVGLVVGALFGAKIMLGLPPHVAKRVYGVFLAIIAARMLLFGK